MFTTLPIKGKYSDKIDLAKKVIELYAKFLEIESPNNGERLTPRNIDILTVCMLEDINSKKFKEILFKVFELKSDSSIYTELSRLRKGGYIRKDGREIDVLDENLTKLKEIINNNENIALYFGFEKK